MEWKIIISITPVWHFNFFNLYCQLFPYSIHLLNRLELTKQIFLGLKTKIIYNYENYLLDFSVVASRIKRKIKKN